AREVLVPEVLAAEHDLGARTPEQGDPTPWAAGRQRGVERAGLRPEEQVLDPDPAVRAERVGGPADRPPEGVGRQRGAGARVSGAGRVARGHAAGYGGVGGRAGDRGVPRGGGLEGREEGAGVGRTRGWLGGRRPGEGGGQ